MPRETFNHPGSSANIPISVATRAGDTVYISGQVSRAANGDIVGTDVAEQTEQVFKNCKAALALAGATLDDVVKVNIYLTDVNAFAAMNEVYKTYFPANAPARATVGAPLASLGLLVEMDMVAYAPK